MSVVAFLLISPAAVAAQERAGVVTNVEGPVTVSRTALPEPAPLRFRDNVFVQDRIATGPKAVARMLLGGHAVVTVREHSVVTITESPNVSTVAVGQGRVAVAVARERMRPGDVVEVRTPNAVAGIRGTVIVAEVRDETYSAITVLKGVIDVRRLDDGGSAVGAPLILNKLQRVVIVSNQRSLPPPNAVSIETGRRLGDDFRLAPARTAPEAAMAPLVEAEIERASALILPGSRVPIYGGLAKDTGNASSVTSEGSAIPATTGTGPIATPATATGAPTNATTAPTASTSVAVSTTPTVSTTSPVAVSSTSMLTTTSPAASVSVGLGSGTVNSSAVMSLPTSAKNQSAHESVLEKAVARDALKIDRSGSNRGKH